MSADPPSSSGLPARSRPVLSELSKQTTEEDLWDLDEEPSSAEAGSPEPQPESPRPAKGAADAKPKTTVIEARLEHTQPKQKSVASKEPRRTKVVDAFDGLDDEAPETPAAGPPPEPPPSAPVARKSPESTPPDEEAAPAPASAPAAKPALKLGLNRREVIGLGIFSFVLLFAAIWGLAGFFGHLHFTEDTDDKIDLPVEGRHAVIAAAESFWREPIREGSHRDSARSAVTVIPVVELTLAPGGGSGALRVLFRNDRGEPVGDTITRTFSGGKFSVGGTERTECSSSDGFEETGDFNAYRTGQSQPWTVLVLEGPGPDAPASEFSTLFEMPLSTLLR